MRRIEYEGDKTEVYSTAGRGDTFVDVLSRRLSRRGLLRSAAAASALAVTGPRLVPVGALAQDATPAASPLASPGATPGATPTATVGGLGFEPITLTTGDTPLVAAGHNVSAFLKWGEPLFPDAPAFDPANQSAAAQARQFGYNCDWIGFLPLPQGSNSSDHGLLVVNHEYTNPELMFPDYLTPNPDYRPSGSETDLDASPPEFLNNPTRELVDIQLEAHGLSVVEVRRTDAGEWQIVRDSPYNRRLTATTPMQLTGPAAGTGLTKTSADPDGVRVLGTMNNCAGGVTPWGTVVSGEENFQQYFANLGQLPDGPVRVSHERFGVEEEASERGWERFYDRFDLTKEPNEPFRYGWGVEFDPYDPQSVPKKRTALGRAKHEGHTSAVAPGGRVAIYSGDDERFEYAYKFVTAGAYDPNDRAANMDLLDEGTLYVARFDDDGTGEWLPLVHGQGPLTEANGFASQAEVLIDARFAADLLGATKMDRPEDFETNPVTGKVYLVCTNNSRRAFDEIGLANPRPENLNGHIIEITEDGNDHAATTFGWEMFLLAGDPANGATWFAGFDSELVSPISSPDNITFDLDGNLWISTDGLPNNLEGNDGLFAVPTEGDERGFLRQFFSSVIGAEVSGPVFTPDNTTLFASIQHPAEDTNFLAPATRWPDGDPMPPRPSVVVIQADDPTARVGTGPSEYNRPGGDGGDDEGGGH